MDGFVKDMMELVKVKKCIISAFISDFPSMFDHISVKCPPIF